MIIEERFFIAPKQYRLCLILHHSLDLIYGVCYCLYYLDNLGNGKLSFASAWFRCSYLFLIFMFSLVGSILYVLVIPQLITLNQNSRKDFINALKLLLKQKLNLYMTINKDIINLLGVLGLGLIFWDYFTSSNEENITVKNLINYQFSIYLIKQFIISYLYNKLEKSILEEKQHQSIYIYKLNQNSEIIKEQCPICYDSFKSKDIIGLYLCAGKHKFHKECLMKWLQMPYNKNKTCPYCKQNAQVETKPFL